MQVGSLQGKNLPDYPSGIDPSNLIWPTILKSEDPVFCFHWKQTKENHWNKKHLDQVRDYTLNHGAGLYPEATVDLKLINQVHLDRVYQKFNYMRNQYILAKQKDAAENAAEAQAVLEEGEENIEEVVEEGQDKQ